MLRRRAPSPPWTLAIVSIGLFMVVLDNLVVNVALPSIHRELGASIESLEWTVNAYILSYAVLLLTGAALGDRFGRKRMFIVGLTIFTAASAGAALAPNTGLLIATRAIQGVGAAIATPITLALLAEAFPPERRGLAFGLVRSQTRGWGATEVIVSLALGAVLLSAFVAYELRTSAPMLPMRFFADRSFSVANVVSVAMYFGMFGSIFFLSQFMQNVLHNSPLQAGLKLLVWTGATMVVAPLAGYFSQRFGSRWFMAAGLALQAIALAWLAEVAGIHTAYASMIAPFLLAGSGMALVFAPVAAAILDSVAPDQAGQASGANNAIREVGGVLGIAVLGSVFSSNGSYLSGSAFVSGLQPALWVGVAVLAAGALLVTAVPSRRRVQAGSLSASVAPAGA